MNILAVIWNFIKGVFKAIRWLIVAALAITLPVYIYLARQQVVMPAMVLRVSSLNC